MADPVVIGERQGMALATILARRGVSAAAIGKAIGGAMPAGPHWTARGDLAVIGNGPGSWLACRGDAPPGWCADLAQRLAGLASVSEQSGAYRLFRIEGPQARTLLQRGVAIDLDRSVFVPGAAACAAIAHIDVILCCRADGESYEVAVYRSYAESFLRWIDAATKGL